MKKTKEEDIAAKEKENEELRVRNDYQEREIRDLKNAAQVDGEVLKKPVSPLCPLPDLLALGQKLILPLGMDHVLFPHSSSWMT